jgi:DNA polymerase-3 subunit epsilon
MKKTNPVVYAGPELERLHQLVAGAQAQLAELETDYTREKSRVDAVQAVLFRLLRGHYQKRDRLQLAVEHRQRFLDSFLRDSTDEAEQSERDFQQAKVRLEEDYKELAAAADKKEPLTAEHEAELMLLWNRLVKLHQPGRFAGEPDKLETYHKLTAAINRAKDAGNIELLREIADDPHDFILHQGSGDLDFSDNEELTQLRHLHGTLQAEIKVVVKSLKQLRASPDYELCLLAEQKAGVLDELAAERAKQLEIENAELEMQAEQLAKEIKKLSGQSSEKII